MSFLKKTSIVSRQTATGLGFFPILQCRAQKPSVRLNPHHQGNFDSLIDKEKERAGRKPGSVVDNHSSGTAVTDCLKQPTREPVQARYGRERPSAPLFGLAPGGVCRAAVCCHPRGALLPHHFTLTGTKAPAVYFLWHFPWVRTLQALPGALPDGARTFLHISVEIRRLPGRLSLSQSPRSRGDANHTFFLWKRGQSRALTPISYQGPS